MPGTVHRHFPAKGDLVSAGIRDRLATVIGEGYRLRESASSTAFFASIRLMVVQWGPAERGHSDALARSGTDVNDVVPDGVEAFIEMLDALLTAGQHVGVVRRTSPRGG